MVYRLAANYAAIDNDKKVPSRASLSSREEGKAKDGSKSEFNLRKLQTRA